MLDKFRETAITWDKANRKVYEPLRANAGDNKGRKLSVQVVNNGVVENLSGATLSLYWETKSKTYKGLDAFTAVNAAKGEFEIYYTTGMLSNEGTLNANLVLVDASGRIVSEPFTITVFKGIDDDAIQSSDSFTALTEALIDISNLEQNYAPRLNDLTAQLQQHGTNVKEFGAVGDGVHDDTLAIQSAIDYCLAQPTTPIGSLGGGYPQLFLPPGIYKVTEPLKITNTNGFTIIGSGQQSTQIVMTADSKTLFEIASYLNFSMSFLTLFAGNLDNINGNIVYSYKPNKTNVCFDFNSSSSGAGMTQTNVTHGGFKTVYQSKKSTVNGDNHTYRSCQYLNNSCVWDNTNGQAVIWSFYDCKAYYNDDIFINPATFLYVQGGDWINKGTFLTGNLKNTTSDLIFDGLRFENYQNIDPTTNPKLLNLSATSGTILFKNCKARGGGSLADKVTATIVGLWNIKCVNCFLQGIWDVTASTSSDGLTSAIEFESCSGAPRINQILSTSQSNKPINLRYTDHAIGTIGRVERNYYGMLPTNTTSVPAKQMTDVTSFLGVISFNTLSKKIPVFNVEPYRLRVYEVNLTFTNNTPNPPKLTLWTSEEKTTKVFEQTLPALNGEWQFIKIPSDVMNTHNIGGSGNVLFLEISSEANSGTCRFTMEITYKQVN